jgi:hypothetical protein
MFNIDANGYALFQDIEAIGGDFYNINIKNRYSETDFINKGTLVYSRSGFYSITTVLSAGWYFIDMAGGGGGVGGGVAGSNGVNGGNSINQTIGNITNQEGYIRIYKAP